MKINPTYYARAYLAAVASAPVAKRHEIAHNLWQTVWRHGHFKWYKKIIANVQVLIRQEKGIKLAEVLTPQALSETQKNTLATEIKKAIGQPVELVCSVKPHLLAGMIVTIDDKRYDASLKGRLDTLYKTLAGENNS
ncbi:MAG: ATP synthase subunit delta [Parcubacteria group bacterium GW2011_GWD2_43_10]|uniref:Uncharacterized protein n=5 Tax=Candidatus Vebleniibacteriota TaxID=1817921 RepID=A0A1G2Q7V5_9BACT|nr:MAG: ATP synthase subunit delta [Parcubacteria group bacterium GW2011_GWD1_42_9]KKS82243.1 MAG: ATP synthase subunit delta [Parcubacteria group bacterium GW2011_GWD2_43_10]KKS92778.1 MAG: ATP synthase subunit delta [Parcubacteria group bacterium GW2011_GWE2_43_12]KKT12421.1 MAG: ATP synthase subunit delta [Parcubacteria group bacterium GW2011_GWA1_43_27]KKT14085.1 MAG: ATP synthase subunit delta [Parcubacteria group bacterium GW2011_GWF2_43_38]KKT21581.1 MAG: ATP synthase subunit delta [Par